MEDEPYETCIVCTKLRPESECEYSCLGCNEPICNRCVGSENAEKHELKCERKHNKELNKLVESK